MHLIFGGQEQNSKTININPDGSIIPSTANITTSDNSTYTFTSDNYASLVVQRNNILIDGNGYSLKGQTNQIKGIDLSERINVTVRNLNIANFAHGVYLGSSSGNTVNGNSIHVLVDGILLKSSFGNIISENEIRGGTNAGIYLMYSSNNTISRNTAYGNHPIDNHASAFGISLYFSSGNGISGNNITDNDNGISLAASNNNTISENNVTANDHWAISVAGSDNKLYHNNFVKSLLQATSSIDTNVWDDEYPSGGNYWSDYNGTDLYSGPYQNITGSDGIGDTPYNIDRYSPPYAQDHFPLMKPWTQSTLRATEQISPQALNLRSRGRWITGYIELPEDVDVNSINVSSILLNGTIAVDQSGPANIGDHTNNGIPDLMVKFDLKVVTSLIRQNYVSRWIFGTAQVDISGKLNDGTAFEGNNKINVISAGGGGCKAFFK